MRSVADVVNADLCHGCAACAFVCPQQAIEMVNIRERGIRPVLNGTDCTHCRTCLEVCSGIRLEKNSKSDPGYCSTTVQGEWGAFSDVLEAWSNDDRERYQGSSGGVCTALGRYCLETGFADGVLHIRADPDSPLENIAAISRTVSEIQSGAGSRYAPASLCTGLKDLVTLDRPVIVVGKPCEIAAIEKIRLVDGGVHKNVALTVSIFCGGTPSTQATEVLLGKMGVNPGDVTQLRYRGNGWPGNFSVATKSGPIRNEISYETAWGTVLTKHKPFRCNMCPDSTGESADISVGDAWFRETGNDFPGASLLLVRTERGRELIELMKQKDYLTVSACRVEDLYKAQKGLLSRHRHVFIKVFWLRVLFMPAPLFKGYPLFRNFLRLGFKRCLVTFWTTGRWILSLKIRSILPNIKHSRLGRGG